MEFRILGPLEVRRDGHAFDLGGKKQRALLALLLLNGNRVVSSERLIDALWEEHPPETAQKALQVHVSQLRKLLGKERILTQPPGYMLRVEPEELDLDRFERLRAPGGVDGLTKALALWRGPPLGDFAYDRFAQSEIARLEELRLAAFEDRIDAVLAQSRHAELIGQLEALVKEHPLRERLRGQLMLALYRSGRQVEALDAYQEARRALVEELGIEPGKPLRELQHAILKQDARLDLPAKAEAALSIFVDREAELAELLGGLEDALAGRGRLFLLSGEPGIGKSRLAEELIAHARVRGVRALVGRCWEAGGAPAYWPWAQSLRAYIRDTEPEALRAQLGAGAAELAQILPELRELLPGLPEPASLDSEGARFRLFDATAEFLRNACKSRPLLLVLDDLHAADAPSLLLLQFAARGLDSTRMLVLGTFRDIDPLPGQPLTELLTEVARERGTRRLSLQGLSARDVGEYVELTAGEIASPELVEALHEETEGNPLFVSEIVRLLSVEGIPSERTAGLRFAIPQSVREVITRRLARLSKECNRVLVLASVLGREFVLDALARLADISEDELLETLDEAMAARVVSDVPGGPARLRFAHVLIRDTVYEGLTTVRRVRLHREAIEALEALYGDDPGPHLAELAHHSIAGSDFEKGLLYAWRAGDRALALLAYEEAARLYDEALRLLDTLSREDEATRCELLLALGDAQNLAGEGLAARETFLHAAEIARKEHSRGRLARAALGYAGRDVWGPRAEGYPKLVPLLEEALAGCEDGDSVLRARLLARLASALRGALDRERPASLARQAVELSKRAGDRSTLLEALEARLAATGGPGAAAESLADSIQVVRLAEELGDQERALDAHTVRLYAAWTLGERSIMAAEVEAMTRLAEDLRQPRLRWELVSHHAMSALCEGRFEAAEELIAEAFRVGERAQAWHAVAGHRLQTFLLRGQRGCLEGYEGILRASLDEYAGYRIFECVLAHAYCQLGREIEARDIFESMAADAFRGLSLDEDWLANACLLSEVCTYLGDTSRAGMLYGLLMPFGSLNAVASAEVALGSVARSLGLLATELARYEEAVNHFDVALEMNARMGARPWLAHTQYDYARMLLARDEPGDVGRAHELLSAALATYRELGMESYAAAASALAVV